MSCRESGSDSQGRDAGFQRGNCWFVVTSVLEQKVEGRNKEGGSKCSIVGGILGERRWWDACPREDAHGVFTAQCGEFVQKRRLRVLEKGALGPGREEVWSWPGIRVALWK